jgi:exosortase family protein XrtF
MKSLQLSEFKPTIFFLLKFVGLYLVANLLYGYFITSFNPRPDPITHAVANQTAFILRSFDEKVGTMNSLKRPTTSLVSDGKGIIAVYEGCNGINTIIIFVSFLIAFGPLSKNMLWFTALGILIIHLTNLARVALLFMVSKYMHQYLYFTHKYFFTAILYFVIFILWIIWVKYFSYKKT